MKKLFIPFFISAIALSIFPSVRVYADSSEDLYTSAKSSYLMDHTTHTCMYKNNALKHVPIASVCKVMTLSLAFDAIEEGKIDYSDEITVSEHAASMGGSQVFLQAGSVYTIDQLLESIVVCSANDSCVAISEAICGNEELFVKRMNEKAQKLGCNDTVFTNCTGLPKLSQYSCAKDVAIMFSDLIQNDKYFSYSNVWLDEFKHPDNRITSITNTNKLIRKYKLCDGGKTGFTNEAGFCLASTAKKDNLRLIAVVLGEDSSDVRFNDTIKMYDYGFANYSNQTVLAKDIPLNDPFVCNKGKKTRYMVRPLIDCDVLIQKGKKPNVSFEIIDDKIYAPVDMGQKVGKIMVYQDNVLYQEIDVVSCEKIDKADYFDNLKEIAQIWAV